MIDLDEKIFKCSRCNHFREKTALDFGFICPVHGLKLIRCGTLRDFKNYYDQRRP